MKTFSERSARSPVSRATAWACLLINALVCPGLGSLMARRRSGLPQLGLSWGGALWMAVPLFQYFADWIPHLQTQPDWRIYVDRGRGGLAFFLAGWFWSIFTGLRILHQARRVKAAPGDEPPRLAGPRDRGLETGVDAESFDPMI